MKTKIMMSAMTADNPFRIGNYQNYAQIDVVVSNADDGGKDAVTMSIPWVHSLPYMDEKVQDAIKKCRAMAEKSLTEHLEARAAREAKMTLWEKFTRFARREFAHLWSMRKISVDKDKEVC